jgi:hypothetical protein
MCQRAAPWLVPIVRIAQAAEISFFMYTTGKINWISRMRFTGGSSLASWLVWWICRPTGVPKVEACWIWVAWIHCSGAYANNWTSFKATIESAVTHDIDRSICLPLSSCRPDHCWSMWTGISLYHPGYLHSCTHVRCLLSLFSLRKRGLILLSRKVCSCFLSEC